MSGVSRPTPSPDARLRYEEESPNCYLFSALGNDTRSTPTPTRHHPSATGDRPNYPTPICRRSLRRSRPGSLGDHHVRHPVLLRPGKSFQIWCGSPTNRSVPTRSSPPTSASGAIARCRTGSGRSPAGTDRVPAGQLEQTRGMWYRTTTDSAPISAAASMTAPSASPRRNGLSGGRAGDVHPHQRCFGPVADRDSPARRHRDYRQRSLYRTISFALRLRPDITNSRRQPQAAGNPAPRLARRTTAERS